MEEEEEEEGSELHWRGREGEEGQDFYLVWKCPCNAVSMRHSLFGLNGGLRTRRRRGEEIAWRRAGRKANTAKLSCSGRFAEKLNVGKATHRIRHNSHTICSLGKWGKLRCRRGHNLATQSQDSTLSLEKDQNNARIRNPLADN